MIFNLQHSHLKDSFTNMSVWDTLFGGLLDNINVQYHLEQDHHNDVWSLSLINADKDEEIDTFSYMAKAEALEDVQLLLAAGIEINKA